MTRSRLRLAAAIVVQLAILALVPWRQVAAGRDGEPVTLRTAPVDPFDPFTGAHVVLDYEAEEASPADAARLVEGQAVWVTVERAVPAWRPVSVTGERPDPAPGRASMRATWRMGRAHLEGAGRFHLPAEKAKAVEEALRPAGVAARERPRALVDLRVDRDGNVRLLRIRVGDRSYGD